MSDTTPWGRVFLLFLAGVVAAFLIGKAPVALPLLRADLGLTVFQAGMVVSLFSVVAACGAAMFGAFADRFCQLYPSPKTLPASMIRAAPAGRNAPHSPIAFWRSCSAEWLNISGGMETVTMKNPMPSSPG